MAAASSCRAQTHPEAGTLFNLTFTDPSGAPNTADLSLLETSQGPLTLLLPGFIPPPQLPQPHLLHPALCAPPCPGLGPPPAQQGCTVLVVIATHATPALPRPLGLLSPMPQLRHHQISAACSSSFSYPMPSSTLTFPSFAMLGPFRDTRAAQLPRYWALCPGPAHMPSRVASGGPLPAGLTTAADTASCPPCGIHGSQGAPPPYVRGKHVKRAGVFSRSKAWDLASCFR